MGKPSCAFAFGQRYARQDKANGRILAKNKRIFAKEVQKKLIFCNKSCTISIMCRSAFEADELTIDERQQEDGKIEYGSGSD